MGAGLGSGRISTRASAGLGSASGTSGGIGFTIPSKAQDQGPDVPLDVSKGEIPSGVQITGQTPAEGDNAGGAGDSGFFLFDNGNVFFLDKSNPQAAKALSGPFATRDEVRQERTRRGMQAQLWFR